MPSSATSVAPMGEEELGLAARAVARARDRLHARRPQAALDRLGEIEVPIVHDVVAEARTKRLGDLLPHLVAARPDSRADRGSGRARHRGDAVFENAFDEPAPADVEDDEPRGAVLACERDREAVRREKSQGSAGLLRPEPVTLFELGARRDDAPAVRLCQAIVAVSGSAPTAPLRMRRFSTTRSGSSSVRIPRFSDSKSPSLTPPSRVENAAKYRSPSSCSKIFTRAVPERR